MERKVLIFRPDWVAAGEGLVTVLSTLVCFSWFSEQAVRPKKMRITHRYVTNRFNFNMLTVFMLSNQLFKMQHFTMNFPKAQPFSNDNNVIITIVKVIHLS